jgi:hypothetical protein
MAGMAQGALRIRGWSETDEKSDHFVGMCYSEYVTSGGQAASEEFGQAGDSLSREVQVQTTRPMS